MKKYKKIIIIFSLILSILFLNINSLTGVYCVDVDNTSHDTFNYNIFNPNLIPFYVNTESGVGWYYTGGYSPEIALPDDEIDGYEPSWVGSDYDYLYQLLGIGNTNTNNLSLTLCFNAFKTHFYYYDGTKITLYCNGSSLNGDTLSGNYYVDLNKFLYNFLFIISS